MHSTKLNFQASFHSISTLIRRNYQRFVKPLSTTFVKSEMNKLYEKSGQEVNIKNFNANVLNFLVLSFLVIEFSTILRMDHDKVMQG